MLSKDIRLASRNNILENECLSPITQGELLTFYGPILLVYIDPAMKVKRLPITPGKPYISKGLRWFRTSHPCENGRLGFANGFWKHLSNQDVKSLPISEVIDDDVRDFWVNFHTMHPLLIKRFECFVDTHLAMNYVKTVLDNTIRFVYQLMQQQSTNARAAGHVLLYTILHHKNINEESDSVADIISSWSQLNISELFKSIIDQLPGEIISECQWSLSGYLDVYDESDEVTLTAEDITRSLFENYPS
ncbi:Hypothetical protein POVR1_LOCUS15 [uncultured virus]|nr:Hypothetical protein POVR1_LOCUS15 [uncultured virus]